MPRKEQRGSRGVATTPSADPADLVTIRQAVIAFLSKSLGTEPTHLGDDDQLGPEIGDGISYGLIGVDVWNLMSELEQKLQLRGRLHEMLNHKPLTVASIYRLVQKCRSAA